MKSKRGLVVFKSIATVIGTAALLLTMPSSNSSPADLGLVIHVAAQGVVLFPHDLSIDVTVMLDGVVVPEPDLIWQLESGPEPTEFTPSRSGVDVSFPTAGDFEIALTVAVDGLSEKRLIPVSVYVPDATYFVSPDGNNRNDGRTIGTPFRTLKRAARLVRPGDIVLLRGGVYHEYNTADSWYRSGLPDAPITFRNYPGETVIIDGSEATRSPRSSNPSAPELIRIVDLDWYVFDGLVFRNSIGRGLALEGNHHTVLNVTAHSNHGDGFFIRGDFNRIEDSVSYDNYSRSNGGDSADGLKIDSGEGNVVRRLTAFDNSDDGIDLWASTRSLVEYNVAYRNGRGTTGNGNGFKLSSARVNADSTIRFNVAYSNRAHNFTDNGGGYLNVYNNTSYDAGEFGFVFRGRPDLERSTVVNNISFEDSLGVLLDVQTRGGTRPDSRSNSWDLDIRDPGFVSLRSTDDRFLHLRADSEAVDAGIDVGVPYVGAGKDLGAFEAQASD